MIEKYDSHTQRIWVEGESAGERILSWLSLGKHLPINNMLVVYAEEVLGAPFRRILMNRQRVKANRIVFGTYQNNYVCNCKYIAQYIIDHKLDYELIFIVNTDVYENVQKYDIPAEIKLVRRNSIESFYALATAKFWFDNSLNCIWRRVPKKKSQYYFNTWHGSLGIKKLAGNFHWRIIAGYGNKTIDYFITDSTFDEEVFGKSFWPSVKFLKVGHPRNDILADVQRMKVAKNKIYDYYGIDLDKRALLYAPTFRDNKNDVSAFKIDFTLLKEALKQRFGGEWVILTRLHYHNYKNENTRNCFAEEGNVIDVSAYPDMQEIMAAADAGVTDYSSWIFDYIATGRPGFIYAEDIDKYINDRGFYYSLSETPFSIAGNSDELIRNIKEFDEASYKSALAKFLQGKGYYGQGRACEQIINTLRKESL